MLLQMAQAAEAEPGHRCLIEPKMVVKLGSQATGVLDTVLVDRGDRVRAGSIVATLDSTIEARNAAIAHLRARNDTEVRLAEVAAQFEDTRHSRRSELWKNKNVSDEVYEKAELDARMRRLDLERAKIALELARLDADRAQALLDLRTIRSPVDGVVIARKMSPGEFVRDESQIMEIAQIDPLHVNVFLPVQMFNRIRIGMVGIVRPEAAFGQHRSKVTMKDSVVDAASSTFLVRLELPNARGDIPSGVHCDVIFADD
jgi:RND family efflux transporter MFP subunit